MTTARINNAQLLADVIVERFDVHPPVDVARLVENYASITELTRDIPDVDALLLGLDSDHKHVLLNPERKGQRRRFTLAHELGHILIAWHEAHELLCVADSEYDVDEPAISHRLPGADPKSQEIRAQELEADAFAARTLVPKRFVDTISSLPVEEMLLRLETADVSIPAGMRALSESLTPGYVFAMLDNRNFVTKTWHSGQGRTGVPRVGGISRGEAVDKHSAMRTLAESGWAYHYGHRIWWGRADVDVPVPESTDQWKPFLQTICDDLAEGNPAMSRSLYQSVMGICGALVNDIDEASQERVTGLMMIRLKRRQDLDAFVNHPAFEKFVYARALALHRTIRKRGPRAFSNTLRI